MNKVISAWEINLLRLLNQGYPLETAASICKIGMDKILHERKINEGFDRKIKEADSGSSGNIRVRF